MSITLDPTLPANTEAQGGGLGASRIRNITSWVLQLLGQNGTAPVTYSTVPFVVDTGTGLAVVPANPTVALGIATKQYVDSAVGTGIPKTQRAYNSLTEMISVSNGVPTTVLGIGMIPGLPLATSPYGQWEIDVTGRFSFLPSSDNCPISGSLALRIGGETVNYGGFVSGSTESDQAAFLIMRTVQLASDGDDTIGVTMNVLCNGGTGTVLATDPESGYLCTELMLIARPL